MYTVDAGAEMIVLAPTVLAGAEMTVPVSTRPGWGHGIGPAGVRAAGGTGGRASATGSLAGPSSASLALHGLKAMLWSRLAHALGVSAAGAGSLAGLLRLLTGGGLLGV